MSMVFFYIFLYRIPNHAYDHIYIWCSLITQLFSVSVSYDIHSLIIIFFFLFTILYHPSSITWDTLLPRDWNSNSEFLKSYSRFTYLDVSDQNGPLLRLFVNWSARFSSKQKKSSLSLPQHSHGWSDDACLHVPYIGILMCSLMGI